VTISKDQNSNELISLLAAQRHFYSKAKTAHGFRFFGALLWLALSPCIVYFLPHLKTSIAIASCLIFLFSEFIFEPFERYCINTASLIQEEFDVKLFGIPWNQVLAGSRISTEITDSAARAFGPKLQVFSNWYDAPEDLPKSLQILICQRANLVWDSRVRSHFGYVLYFWALLIAFIGLAISFSLSLSLSDYLLVFLIPSLSPIVGSYRWGLRHFDVALEKTGIENRFLQIWKKALENQGNNIEADCRTIQDSIFQLRRKKALVPDWFYRLLHPDFQQSMVSAATALAQEARSMLLPPHSS